MRGSPFRAVIAGLAAGSAAVGLAAAVLATGCTDPNVWGREWACTSDDDCAGGWHCGAAGVCVRDGTDERDGAGALDGLGGDTTAPRADGRGAGGDAGARPPDGAGSDGDAGTDADCPCPDGPCCLGCRFREAGFVCEPDVDTELGCPEGPACGGRVGQRTADRVCTGESAGCEQIEWREWKTVATCDRDQGCDADALQCREEEGCACAVTCDDADACTHDGCDAAGLCRYEAVDCDDGDDCTSDGCDPEAGCRNEPVACDDGDDCTLDVCLNGEGCQHDGAPDGTECRAEGGAVGRCREGACCVPLCEGRACGDDGCGGSCGACDEGEACDGGGCVAVPDCGDGVCDPDAGESCRTCRGDCPVEGATPETCDGVDDDCDGATDEDLPARACERSVAGVGTCVGSETCRGVAGWVCDAPAPALETCDGADDDCDGATDEDLDDPAAAGCRTAGVCALGVAAVCEGGLWRCEYGGVDGWEAEESACDGRDNDCDGATDEAAGDPVAAGCAAEGVCGAGGVAVACEDAVWRCGYDGVVGWEPLEASCDGADNDCDGATDEDLRESPGAGCPTAGVCAEGVARVCEDGAWRCQTEAVAAFESAESRCDGLDNDCDGETDEGLAGVTTGTDCAAAGVCAAGVEASCGPGGWVCDYAAVAGWEAVEAACDSQDNDCDGLTDEDVCAFAGEPCATDADCAAGPCRLDVDGVGRFCAATASHCVLALTAAAATQTPNGYVHCIGGSVHHRRCEAGVWSAARTCDDGDPCTTDVCAAGTGCATQPAPPATPCDDGDPCTLGDHCQNGACAGGAPDPCDDGVACTMDACTATGCQHTPVAAACDDGLACTDDTCDAQAGCRHDPLAARCDDGLACTVDACVPPGGCTHTPQHGGCDDGVACTVDRCDAVAGCVATPDDAACDDGVACTADACDPVAGCAATPDDALCVDDKECTRDTCDPVQGCLHPTDSSLCDDGLACTVDWCHGFAGTCMHDEEDGWCWDGIACTVDRCEQGVGCVFEPDDAACPGNGCGFAVCDPAAGGCTADAPRCDCVALQFAGHERVSAPDAPGLSGGPGASRTLEIWFRLDALESRGWGAPILTKVNDETSGDWALLAVGDDLVFRWFRAGSPTPLELTAYDVLTVGQWTHAAVVVDRAAGEVRLLLNGATLATAPSPYDLADTTAPLYVGATPKLWPGSFKGALDELRVWTVARAEAAIAADFERPLGGAESGLAHYWSFEDVMDTAGTRESTDLSRDSVLSSELGAHIPLPTRSFLNAPACARIQEPNVIFNKYLSMQGEGLLGLYNAGAREENLAEFVLEIYHSGSSQNPTVVPLAPHLLAQRTTALICSPGVSVQTGCYQYMELPFDGDDAIVLKHAGTAMDVFGQIGVDPGDGWFEGDVSSYNSFIIRNCSVARGRLAGTSSFSISSEWHSHTTLVDHSPLMFCGTCDAVACPELPEVAPAACNSMHHCEYTNTNAFLGPYGTVIWIPPSSFTMGDARYADRTPKHEVSFGHGFFVDKYEVSTEAFARFLNSRDSNACAHGGVTDVCFDPDGTSYVRWDGQSASILTTCPQNPGHMVNACYNLPMIELTWPGAGAVCEWFGGRLCSEAEWERVARGTEGYQFPWGNEPVPASFAWDGRANCLEADCSDGESGIDYVQSHSLGASDSGARNLAGNVAEWVEDDWHSNYTGAPDEGEPWRDAPRASSRVVRGGSHLTTGESLQGSSRGAAPTSTTAADLGVRCCRDAP